MPATLRKIGGSVMVAIPPAILEHLRLRPGETVDVAAENGRIAITPQSPRRYSLDELLAEHAGSPASEEARDWTRSKAAGRELI